MSDQMPEALRDSSCIIGSAINSASEFPPASDVDGFRQFTVKAIDLRKELKDPNVQKREKSKKQFNEEHPDKSYSADVFKDFATKWECMTNAEKAPYVQEVEKQMRKTPLQEAEK
ncbi:hypothetical protein COLO4_08260 [Corchorus olitorius]|uniref:HMG box domain-containing protein n=1 Tax=Corchorus olitorius TaxID=93759 RepID=A0A1R3KGK9_9ROSI|nr:hypothetical protein COLO4_08260 [Corchorus olitorius]